MESSPLADLITSLAKLHHTQHQALLQLRRDQEQLIKDLLNTQTAGRQVLQGRDQQAGIPAMAPAAAVAPPPRCPHQDGTAG